MSSPNEPENSAQPERLPSPAPRAGRPLWVEILLAQLAVLLLVVLGFGGTVYGLLRQSIYREAEADLFAAAQLIERDLASGQPATQLEISRTYWHRFGPAPRDRAYFVVWQAAGKLLADSGDVPKQVTPAKELPKRGGPRPYATRWQAGDLQVIARGPRDEQILIGRPLGKEQDRLRNLLSTLALIGLAALAIGGLVAWWLARRITQPIEQLTQTAEQISARQLDQRLPSPTSSTELLSLATVFNRMLDRLQGAFQQQTRFTSDASHELRTPVTVILTQAEHSLARPRSSDEYRAALDTCLRAARRMKRLVDDLLLLARADAGRLQPRREVCDLAEVARTTLAWLEPLASEQKIQLMSQLTSTLTAGDAQQLGQVVANLVGNAIQYNRPGGEVQVTTATEDGWALLRVRDKGPGIALADQSRIFERFFRADQARTVPSDSTAAASGQGTGLGLSIVAEIVTAHGGTILVESSLGDGSTFTVRLPLEDEAAEAKLKSS
ncbi:Sensor kinase CusS [Anatilimnocola aggregata]|uniref:histidine kinase n=1 Tax=Anatilimnocola aggregata TaxID=2528021 RepID=A0A517YB66_9BACT|nr:ATP-binding protein [Anatilimnocola aggregata]QDU27485.1 Sensor kinase CusS [Anatilimnocola aggregata]